MNQIGRACFCGKKSNDREAEEETKVSGAVL